MHASCALFFSSSCSSSSLTVPLPGASSTLAGLRKFYRKASAVFEADLSAYSVRLDGKCCLTPSRKKLLLPNSVLAAAVATKWDYQKKHIRPHTMPLVFLPPALLPLGASLSLPA